MRPKVSIIVPVYNVEKYLSVCLDSLINQTFNEIEIICVNDGSTDNSLSILKQYQKKDERIRIINQKNQGLSHSRNVALKYAKGDYILYVDSDDWLDLNTVKDSYQVAKMYDLDLLIFLLINYDESKDELYEDGYYNNIWFPSKYDDKTFSFDEISQYTFILACSAVSKLYKRDLLLKNNMKFPKGLYFEDNPFHCESLICSEKIRILRKHFYYRRRRNNSITSDADEKYFDTIPISNLVIDAFKKYDVYEKYIELLLNRKIRYLIYCYNLILDQYKKDYLKLIYNDFKKIKSDPQTLKQYNTNLNFLNKKFFDAMSELKNVDEINFLLKKYEQYDNSKVKTPKLLNEMNVAAIMDALTYNSYSSECNLILLEPDNWLQKFEENKIDFFFCESAWFGIDQKYIKNNIAIDMSEGPWLYKVSNSNNDNQAILDILSYCNENNIPTIFWNKEDPVSFDLFVDLALNFDYIFTTDVNSIVKYTSRGHKNVYPLIFASQVKQFNPIERKKRSNKIIFAGSWYGTNPERCEITEEIFDKLLENNYELKVYNRKSDTTDKQWKFPDKYDNYIFPKITENVSEIHKESKYALNINTVTDSESMFSRRIFELASSNTCIISNYSEGLYNIFGDNIIYFDKIHSINLENINQINRMCENNLYNVLRNHTYAERLKYILNIIHIDFYEKHDKIYVIYNINSPKDIKNINDDFNSIEFINKECIIIFKNKDILNNISNNNSKQFLFINYYEFNIELNDNVYYIFRNLSKKIDVNFIKNALLHYKYLDKTIGIRPSNHKYILVQSSDYYDVLFNSKKMKEIFENLKRNKIKNYDVYNI